MMPQQETPEQTKAPIKSTPKDFFAYLLVFITLYASITSFIALLFDYIEAFYPFVYTNNPAMDIRYNIAWLIIAFPIFLWTTYYLHKDRRLSPEKNYIRVRMWLTYFTFFIIALVIMCNLGLLLYFFLTNIMTLEFFLKSIVIIATTGLVFFYYQRDLKQLWTRPQLLIWLWASVVVVVLAIGYGLFAFKLPVNYMPHNMNAPLSFTPAKTPVPMCKTKSLPVTKEEGLVIQSLLSDFSSRMECNVGKNCLKKWNDKGVTKFSIAWEKQCGPIMNGVYQLGDNGHGSTFICQSNPNKSYKNDVCCWPAGYQGTNLCASQMKE